MTDLWKFIVVTLTGLVLAGSAIGYVAAQTGDDATSTPAATEEATGTPDGGDDATDTPSEDEDTLRDQFLDDLAGRLGVSREQLDQAMSDTALALVDQAVADGRITEAEAEIIRERIAEGGFPFFGLPGHHRFGLGPGCGVNLEETAEFLGTTVTELRDALAEGQSLAQVAEAQGVSREDLVAFLIGEVEERLNEAVANERITQEEADEKLASAAERIEELVDREGLPFPGKFRFRLPESEESAPEGGTGLIF
jgi:DNA-binding phage protein